MKPTAVFVLIAVFSLGLMAAGAKTVNGPQGDNDRVASTTAGQGAAMTGATAAHPTEDTMHPSKKALKKSKIRQKPPLHDPN